MKWAHRQVARTCPRVLEHAQGGHLLGTPQKGSDGERSWIRRRRASHSPFQT